MLWEIIKWEELLTEELKYRQDTLARCCKNTSLYTKEPVNSMLAEIWEVCEEKINANFNEVFKTAVKKHLKGSGLKMKEIDIIANLFSDTNFYDKEMQINSIRYNTMLLKNVCAEIQKHVNEKARLALYLGVMSGIVTIILLI